MRNILLSITICCILGLSCSKSEVDHCISEEDIGCIDDIFDFGDISLNEPSKEYMVYNGLQDIVFKSQDGLLIRFIPTREKKISFFNKAFEIECINGSLNQYTYIQEQHSSPYLCEELGLGINMNLYTYNSRLSPVFADKFSVTLFEPSTSGTISTIIKIEIIVDNRGYEKLHESGFQCNVDINHDSNVNILGEKYKDVYSNKQNETRRLTELYYNNHFGIVGFKDLDLTLWKFDHFE